MVYRAIGIMSGSSLDGMDIVFTELEEKAGNWSFEIIAQKCVAYSSEWFKQLRNASQLHARDYLLLHTKFGKLIAENINAFITENNLQHRVQLIVSHGHTVFHDPAKGLTSQLGDGAVIAANTGINTVTDLRAMDVALGGQGAPIVPLGEKLLFPNYNFYLNIGGIANITAKTEDDKYIAFDVCPANRVLNMLASDESKPYDNEGLMAGNGIVNMGLLMQLNALDYYKQPYPKSLANSFGTDVIYPMIRNTNISTADGLRTYIEHIAQQIAFAIQNFSANALNKKVLVTGGGAFNSFLIARLQVALETVGIELEVPEENIINYKEALIMALLGVLRWREEDTVINSVTGASRSSIGGAVWIGQEA